MVDFEEVRMQLGVFVKSAALRATVYTIPSKEKGLRLQSSEVHIGVRAGVLRKFL